MNRRKPFDYKNSSNIWPPSNRFNDTSNQNMPSVSSVSLPPPPVFPQIQYDQSQQIQSRTGLGSNLSTVPPVYSNSRYSRTENEDASKSNVSYPLHGQYIHSNCGSLKGRSQETTNRTRHNAFPPPSPLDSSSLNNSEAETRDTTMENCLTENYNYLHSKTAGVRKEPLCNEFNSYDKQNISFHETFPNSYGSSHQPDILDQGNNKTSWLNFPMSYEFSSKTDLSTNSGFSNSHFNQIHNRVDRPISSQEFLSTSLTNFEKAYDGLDPDVEDDSDNENSTSNFNEDNTHEYSSPLDAMETIHSNNNNNNPSSLSSVISDNRRPPPVDIDPNIPQEIAAQFKTSSCDLCAVKLNSRLQAKMHYEGRPHSKKVRQAINDIGNNDNLSSTTDAESLPPKKKKGTVDINQLYCKCCDLSMTSTTHATQHYMGRNHHRVLHGLKPLQAGYYNKETGQWQRTPPDPITTTEQLGLDDKDDLVADSVKHKGKFFCELCGVAATSKEQLDGHLIGQRHSKKKRALKQAEKDEASSTEGSNQNVDGVTEENKNGSKKKKSGKPKKEYLSKAHEAIKSLFESAGTPIDDEEDLFKVKMPEVPISEPDTATDKNKYTEIAKPKKPEVFTRKVHKGFLNDAKDNIKFLFENVLQSSDDSLTNKL